MYSLDWEIALTEVDDKIPRRPAFHGQQVMDRVEYYLEKGSSSPNGRQSIPRNFDVLKVSFQAEQLAIQVLLSLWIVQ